MSEMNDGRTNELLADVVRLRRERDTAVDSCNHNLRMAADMSADMIAELDRKRDEIDRLHSINLDLLAVCEKIDEIQRRGHAFTGEWRERL